MSKPPKAEATLFYDSGQRDMGARLSAGIDQRFRADDLPLRSRLSTPVALAFDVGGLTLSITHAKSEIDLSPYMLARSTDTEFGLLPTTQRVLVKHRDALIIDVSGTAEAGTPQVRLAICLIATSVALKLSTPSLIHWRNSDVFYTPPQFIAHSSRKIRPRAPRREENVSPNIPEPPAPLVIDAEGETRDPVAIIKDGHAFAIEKPQRRRLTDQLLSRLMAQMHLF